jgi:hypothetical protein
MQGGSGWVKKNGDSANDCVSCVNNQTIGNSAGCSTFYFTSAASIRQFVEIVLRGKSYKREKGNEDIQ